MTSFLARVDSEPVSLSSFSFSSLSASVNQQQVFLTIFTVLLTSGISRNENNQNNEKNQNNGIERSGLE